MRTPIEAAPAAPSAAAAALPVGQIAPVGPGATVGPGAPVGQIRRVGPDATVGQIRPVGQTTPAGPTTPASPAPSASPLRPSPPPSARPRPFAAPSVRSLRELGQHVPVVRLNALESAIGSLVISGTVAIAWEGSDRVTGSAGVDGTSDGTPLITPGNRALVGYDGPDALVSLRHIGQLRRALFIGASDTPEQPDLIGVQLFDGTSFTVSTGDVSRLFVLSLLRVDTLVELRAEPLPRPSSTAAIFRAFGFTMTPHVTARDPRRR